MVTKKKTQIKKLKVGVIGCGAISGAYFEHANHFESMEIVACADIVAASAKAAAKKHNIKAMTVKALLDSKSIDMVLNLTLPQTHASINLKALKAGKHVYSEKPFGLDLNEAKEVIDYADKKNLLVGCAPDTFLGAGHQTARKLIDDNWLGNVVSGTAFMMCPGHESWHPNPGFYYLKGGGPVLDMGPYYITALVNMLGPVEMVTAMSSQSGERTATCEAKNGEKLPVEVDTHVSGTLKFKSGAVITLVMSFDTIKAQHHPIELHGTEASLQVPDPNGFGGNLNYTKRGTREMKPVPHSHIYGGGCRSIGLADMACSIQDGTAHRASGKLAYHVLEIMLALEESSNQNKHIKIKSKCERPRAMPLGLRDGQLTL
jgi:predicted dehydrogenase